ncbi:hypothetical protein D6853_11295 [Butyrivibrio sp. X503]|uniref:hypothetical protein n=1 Tax=Butyrivibrio sp. X503 TaxID=2364878 RepID=UPI000EA8E375|nr:hypothetical protein [Butyrivibrio sp. X503]RKM55296.1 hypothetical protein D6853_11295 [Butyrivibrio sp. X503]
MNIKGMKLAAAVFAAGVFAVTGFTGVQAVSGIATVETVEYAMKENAAEALNLSNAGTIVKDAADLGDIPIKSGQGYKYVYLKGLQGEALLVADHTTDGEGAAIKAKVYVQKDGGPVVYVGEIYTGATSRLISISDNGVIVACTTHSFESFMISADGKKLEAKDSVCFENSGDGKSQIYTGYTRAVDLNSPKVTFAGTLKDYDNLAKTLFRNVEPIIFKVK